MRELVADCFRSVSVAVAFIGFLWVIMLVDACGKYSASTDTLSSMELPDAGTPPEMTVLLGKYDRKKRITFESGKPLSVEWTEGIGTRSERYPDGRLTVRYKGGSFRINDREFSSSSLIIHTGRGTSYSTPPPVRVNQQSYRGSFQVVSHPEEGMRVVNNVNLTAYLWSVVGSEMSSRFPFESLKAHAVAARTYALWEKNREDKRSDTYDLADTVAAQVYKGVKAEEQSIRTAVNKTEGEVLMYNSEILPAFYHSTCGGTTTSAARVIPHYNPEKELAPLVGDVECPWDSRSKHHNWRTSIQEYKLRKALFPGRSSAPSISDIRVLSRDGSDRVRSLVISLSNNRSRNIPGTEFRRKARSQSLDIKSTNFTVSKRGDAFRFKGHGWGHGTGMCQMGAVGAGEEGLSYRSILNHYYPGASIYRLYRNSP